MSLFVTPLFTACNKDEKTQPQFAAADEVSVTPRVRRFVENATTNAAVKNLSILDADSAEWYLEASLNYSVAEAWIECTDRILDSVEVAISMDSGGISVGTASAAFLSLQNQVLSKLTFGENHLIVADARFPDVLGENFVAKVYLQIGSGYDKSVNANYGSNDFWRWGGLQTNCGCGSNNNATGLCAHKRIESRVNASLGKIKPPCYFINVETRGVGSTNAQINFSQTDFPTGIPATPYKIFFCNQGASCPGCFSPALMSFYTQGTWDVMQQIKPANKVGISCNMNFGYFFSGIFWHDAVFTYGQVQCN